MSTSNFGAPRHRRANRWLAGAAVLWLLVVTLGMTLLWKYKLSPAEAAEAAGGELPPDTWPAASVIARDADGGATMVMLAHPKCACTRASISELAALMAETPHDAMTAHVLFVRPRGVPEGWEETDTWRRASAIPGVHVHRDEGGVEARRFAATVSGHTVVYDRDGRLLFHGGITKARGHVGDNPGRDRIRSLVTLGKADRRESPTFGCGLREPPETEKKGN